MITHNGWGALFPLLFVQKICMGLSFVHIFIIVFVGNVHYIVIIVWKGVFS